MPTKKQAKVTRQESEAAQELQAPDPNAKKEKKSLFKSAVSLANSGIQLDDGEGLQYFHTEDYFPEEAFEEGDDGKLRLKDGATSNSFVICNAIKLKSKFGWVVRLTVVEEDESKSWVSLGLGNGEELDPSRMKWAIYFATNTKPIGPMMFVALPSSYGKPYIAIQDAVPF